MTDSDGSLFDRVASEMAAHLDGDSTGHDLHHAWRVNSLGVRIGEAEGADRRVVGVAALVHDLHRVRGEASRTPKRRFRRSASFARTQTSPNSSGTQSVTVSQSTRSTASRTTRWPPRRSKRKHSRTPTTWTPSARSASCAPSSSRCARQPPLGPGPAAPRRRGRREAYGHRRGRDGQHVPPRPHETAAPPRQHEHGDRQRDRRAATRVPRNVGRTLRAGVVRRGLKHCSRRAAKAEERGRFVDDVCSNATRSDRNTADGTAFLTAAP